MSRSEVQRQERLAGKVRHRRVAPARELVQTDSRPGGLIADPSPPSGFGVQHHQRFRLTSLRATHLVRRTHVRDSRPGDGVWLVVVSRVRGDGRRDGRRRLLLRRLFFRRASTRAPDAEEFGIEAVARLESLVHRRAGDVRVAHDGVEVVFCREGGESFRLGDCVAKRGGVAAVGKPERASPERGAGDDADEFRIRRREGASAWVSPPAVTWSWLPGIMTAGTVHARTASRASTRGSTGMAARARARNRQGRQRRRRERGRRRGRDGEPPWRRGRSYG